MILLSLLGFANLPWQANVSWDDVRATEGCFFFSGPHDLGRDDHLGSEAVVTTGPMPSVAFGPHRFRGPADAPMTRESLHDSHGTWRVEESLQGQWNGEAFSGVYVYRERRASDGEWQRCAITAHVNIRPRG